MNTTIPQVFVGIDDLHIFPPFFRRVNQAGAWQINHVQHRMVYGECER